MTHFPVTDLNRVKRFAKRGQYDKQTIHAIIDEALICHVGFVAEGRPVVIPTIHARSGDKLILHGSAANRMLAHCAQGSPVCITFTIVDGIVFARSVFHSSMNYRSVVVFGKGTLLDNDQEKLAAMEILTEHVARGRWKDARKPTKKELDATAVIEVEIETASAKVRTGPPNDDEEDYQLPIWAGVLPISQSAGEAIPDERMESSISPPEYVLAYSRR